MRYKLDVITTHNLSKVYRGGTKALQQVDIRCKESQVYCVLGPNGAGKTTLLRILATQLLPTNGEAHLLDFDVIKEAKEIRKRIAVVPQDANPAAHMSPWQHVFWYLISRGYSFTEARRQAGNALKLLGLWDVKDKYAATLSGGQRKRIIVAMAFSTDAEVLFLDEPTAGLDPLARRQVWSEIRGKVKEGRTVFLTTHLMEEAEMLADSLLIINKGKIIASGTPSELKALLKYKFKVILKLKGEKEADKFTEYGEVSVIGDYSIVYPHTEEKLKQLVADVPKQKFSLTVQPIDIEDVFVKLVGEKL